MACCWYPLDAASVQRELPFWHEGVHVVSAEQLPYLFLGRPDWFEIGFRTNAVWGVIAAVLRGLCARDADRVPGSVGSDSPGLRNHSLSQRLGDSTVAAVGTQLLLNRGGLYPIDYAYIPPIYAGGVQRANFGGAVASLLQNDEIVLTGDLLSLRSQFPTWLRTGQLAQALTIDTVMEEHPVYVAYKAMYGAWAAEHMRQPDSVPEPPQAHLYRMDVWMRTYLLGQDLGFTSYFVLDAGEGGYTLTLVGTSGPAEGWDSEFGGGTYYRFPIVDLVPAEGRTVTHAQRFNTYQRATQFVAGGSSTVTIPAALQVYEESEYDESQLVFTLRANGNDGYTLKDEPLGAMAGVLEESFNTETFRQNLLSDMSLPIPVQTLFAPSEFGEE